MNSVAPVSGQEETGLSFALWLFNTSMNMVVSGATVRILRGGVMKSVGQQEVSSFVGQSVGIATEAGMLYILCTKEERGM